MTRLQLLNAILIVLFFFFQGHNSTSFFFFDCCKLIIKGTGYWGRLLSFSGLLYKAFFSLKLLPLITELLSFTFHLRNKLVSLFFIPFLLLLMFESHLFKFIYDLNQRLFSQKLFQPPDTIIICALAKDNEAKQFKKFIESFWIE